MYPPAMLLAVAVTLACPAASLTADRTDSAAEAPEVGAVKLTVTPLTGLPNPSATVARNGLAKAVLITVLCAVPPVVRIAAAPPAVIVNWALVADVTPVACASSVYVPAWLSATAVNVASPVLSVVALVVPLNDRASRVTPPACSVTASPGWLTAFPALSSSCTVIGGVIACPATALLGCCRKASLLALPGRFVRLKLAAAAAPAVAAVTVKPPACAFAVSAGEAAMP